MTLTPIFPRQPSGAPRPPPGQRFFDAAAVGFGDGAVGEAVGDVVGPRPLPGADRQPSAAVVATAVLGWHRLTHEADVLRAVVESVGVLVPGAVGAAVLCGRRAECGHRQLSAMSGQVPGLTWPVHPDCTTGKCIDLAAAVPVAAVKLGRECNGWPIATTTAGGRGGMVIWVPLGQGTTMCGTLLIATAGVVTDRAETDAVVMAIHASTAAVAARQREELRSAVQSRDVIGQAKGILMQRLQLTATAAFELLARASQDSNLKLWEVCSTLCSTGGLPEPRTASHRRRTPELTATFGQHSPQG